MLIECPPDAHLGFGFDRLSNSMRSLALESDPNDQGMQGGAGTSTMQDFQMVSSVDDVCEYWQVDISAKYSWMAGSISGKASVLERTKISRSSLTIVAYCKIDTDALLLQGSPKLSKEALALCQSEPDSFTSRFGTDYISGYSQGGEFLGLLTIEDVSQEKQNELSLQLNVSAWGADLDAETKKQAQSILSKHQTKIYMLRTGGELQYLPLNLENFIQQYKSYPDSIKAKPYRKGILIAPYSNLASVSPEIRLAQEIRRNYIDSLWHKYKEFKGMRVETEFALKHPQHYKTFDKKDVLMLREELEQQILLIAECAQEFASASAGTVASFKAPARAAMKQPAEYAERIPVALDGTSLDASQKKVINVKAGESKWLSTSMGVKEGDRVTIKALPPTAEMPQTWSIGWGSINADGHPVSKDAGVGLPLLNYARFGQLLAKVGDNIVAAGTDCHFKSTSHGELCLICNDNPAHNVAYSDNGGEIVFEVTVEKS